MKTELISVIEKTIDVLENEKTYYDYNFCETCNCGILAQQALGIGREELRKIVDNYMRGVWSDYSRNEFCEKTGLPIDVITKKLKELGLNARDVSDLELLSNKNVLKKIGLKDGDVDPGDKITLIKYLKAWREILIEEAKSQDPKTEYIVVEIDRSIREQTKELVMN